MNPPSTTTATPANGESTLHELFALTDEQILEIEPEAQDVETGAPQTVSGHAPRANPSTSETQSTRHDPSTSAPTRVGAFARDDNSELADRGSVNASRRAEGISPDAAEPPAWVAEAMNDPERGREARAFWEGSQKTQQEAAAYREVFAKPEEARAAAERARVLDEIDRAYFGAAGNSAEQTSAARAQLAQMMLQENPAAFREMVFAGLRALEEVGNQPGAATVGATLGSRGASGGAASAGGASPAPTAPSVVGAQYAAPQLSSASTQGAHLAAYAAFEKAANEELEKSVGGAIERTIERALPVAQPLLAVRGGGETQARVPALHERFSAAIRQDVEAALKGDRQLSEQIALIISGRRPGDTGTPTPRFDGDTRAQVVRLIDERAKQLVPGAAKRVLQDWTQTTLAAHRSRTRQNETAATRSDLAPANSSGTNPRLQAGDNTRPSAPFDFAPGKQNDNSGGKGTKVDYRKLSDEQILDL